jgi:hypothetical protein
MTSLFADATSDTPVVVGAFVTIIGAFLGIAKIMLNQATKDRESDRKERLALSAAIQLMAKNSGEVAKATMQGAAEAKQRNGHLGEQNIQIAKLVTDQNHDIRDILSTLRSSAVVLRSDTTDVRLAAETVAQELKDNRE